MKYRTNIYKTYNLLIKILIIALSYYFIYKQVFHSQNAPKHWAAIFQLFDNRNLVFLFLAVFILSFLNWGIETYKWKFLISKTEKISFFKAFSAVLSGITVSVFTPNRIGEYFGRVFLLKKTNPWKGVFITVTGSISQLMITLFFGSAGTFFILYHYGDLIATQTGLMIIQNKFFISALFIIAMIINILVVLLYFNLMNIHRIRLNRFGAKISNILSHLRALSDYSFNELLKVLFFSLCRYFVFTFQFYLLLHLFGIKIPFLTGFMLISAVFYIMAAIPSVALSELGIRGSASLFVFGLYCQHSYMMNESVNMGILSASVLLWIINLIIPALIGSFFVMQLRFFKNKQAN